MLFRNVAINMAGSAELDKEGKPEWSCNRKGVHPREYYLTLTLPQFVPV